MLVVFYDGLIWGWWNLWFFSRVL